MAKMIGYRCKKCGKEYEELFQDTKKPPKSLKIKCECGGKLELWNYKQNCHRWNFLDRGGL